MLTLTTSKRNRVQLDSSSREAEGYIELGMHAQALRSLQRRGKLVHADDRACFLLGECLRELQRFREAVFPLRRCIDLNPDSIEARLALGWCYKRLGNLPLAVHCLEEAARSRPDDALVNYNLACYYSLASRRLDALRRLRRSFNLDPNLRQLVSDETDFAQMRDDLGFQMLLAASTPQ